MDLTSTPTPTSIFDPSEQLALRIVILTLGSLSFIVSTFVLLTYLLFAEKRRFAPWSLTAAFVFSVLMIELFLIIGAAINFNSSLHIYCYIQGFFFLKKKLFYSFQENKNKQINKNE